MAVLEVWLVVAALLVALYRYLARSHGYWRDRGVAYDSPVVFFGNTFDSIIMRRNPGQIVTDLYMKYSRCKVVGMFNFNSPGLILRDPSLVHKVLVTDFSHFTDNDVVVDESIDAILARNMFFQTGDKWKRTRQQLSPAFTLGKIKPVFEKMCQVGDKLKNYVASRPQEIALKHLMSLYTSEVVASCGLGIDGQSFDVENPRLVDMGKKIFEPSLSRGFVNLAILMAPAISNILRLSMVPKEVPQFFDEVLRDIVRYRQEHNEKRDDMMQYWIEMKRRSEEMPDSKATSDVLDRVFTDEDILAGCITFFVESYESSSMLAAFTLHHLALQPRLQERLHQEIDQALAAGGGQLTLETVQNMPFLSSCMTETSRLHPAILNQSKRCTKRYAMDIGQEQPLMVEPGTSIYIPSLGLSTDPLYWEDPLRFDPDRHTEERREGRVKGVFQPFGDGPRICIGMRMAMVIIKVGLVSLLRDRRVVPSERTPAVFQQDPRHFMSCHRGGLYAKFVKRL